MPDIEVKCPECGLSKKIPSSKIPDKPVKVNCKRCANSFIFSKAPENQRPVVNQDIAAPPPHQSISAPAPERSSPATTSVRTNTATIAEMAQAQTASQKKNQAFIVVLLFVTIALVPLRIWIANQVNFTPYPNWMATSANGLAVLFGNQFHVLDYTGNLKYSKELPDDTDASQISWHGEDIWVSDWKNERILQFHDDSMREVALTGSEIDIHLNVAVNPPDSHLYIADSQASKIKIYDENGEYVDEFGEAGNSDGSIFFPKDIIFNEEGQLVIGNTMRSSVDVFSTNGIYIKTLIKHEGFPVASIKNMSPEVLKNISPKNLTNFFHQQFIFDFAMDNQNLVTIECNPMVTECNIVSYDLEGNILASIEHQPGNETEGDIALWQDKLFVCNCVNRNIDVYYASTLSYLGAFSDQIDQIGIEFTNKAASSLILSKALLYVMILNFVPIILLYIRSKR